MHFNERDYPGQSQWDTSTLIVTIQNNIVAWYITYQYNNIIQNYSVIPRNIIKVHGHQPIGKIEVINTWTFSQKV